MQAEWLFSELRELLTEDERFNVNQLLRYDTSRPNQLLHFKFKHLPEA